MEERHKALVGHLMYVAQLVAKQGRCGANECLCVAVWLCRLPRGQLPPPGTTRAAWKDGVRQRWAVPVRPSKAAIVMQPLDTA